jgi:hypothetical protein
LAEEERDVKRTARRPARFVATGVVAVGAALTLSGCVLASPAVTNNPYPASDGSAATITDPASKTTVKLVNFLVVGTAKDKAGSLVGSVINTGTADVTVQLSVTSDADGTTSIGEAAIPVAGGKAVQVGPAATALTLSSVPQPPGSVLTLVAKTNGGGSVKVTVPVMAAANEYATLTPSPTPTETPTPKAAPKATPTASAKPSASATS